MVFANALAFDKRGALYITETYSIASDGSFGQGGIWRVPKHGPAELWLRHDLLTGPAFNPMFGFPVGANGIAFRHVFPGPVGAAQILLDPPLSVAFGTTKDERQSLFITNGGMLGLFVPGIPWPGPNLVKIDAGVPGQPLP